MRTSVISDVDQDVRDPCCFEFFDRTNGIFYERVDICHFGAEGTDKQLATKGNSVKWKRKGSINTHNACLISGQDECLNDSSASTSAPRARRATWGPLCPAALLPDRRLTPFVSLVAAQLFSQLKKKKRNVNLRAKSRQRRCTKISYQ